MTAQQLTASESPVVAADRTTHLLIVDVAGHRCALPADVVVEIHPAVQLSPLPDAPEVVLGLLNRRGRPVPVLDLRRRLGLPPRSLGVDDHLVVVQLLDRQMALLVDAALDTVDVPTDAINTAVATTSDAVLSQGVAVLPHGLLVVLDITTFLTSDVAAELDAALQQVLLAEPA